MITPTPRTDTEITFTGTYTCTHHNDAERTACPVCLVTALTAERDQLRADLEQADAFYQRACEVELELRAEVKRMTHAYEYDHKCLCEVQDRCHLWKQRAIKAEAELAKKSTP